MKIHFLHLAIIGWTVSGCDRQTTVREQTIQNEEVIQKNTSDLVPKREVDVEEAEVRSIQPKETLRGLLDDYHYVTFVSRSGKFYGMDSDSLLIFSKNGFVILTELGMGSKDYDGTFEIDADQTIKLDLPTYPGSWPPMRFRRDGDANFLDRIDQKTGFLFGGRSGAVETEEMKPFWPFGLQVNDAPRVLYHRLKEIEQAMPPNGS